MGNFGNCCSRPGPGKLRPVSRIPPLSVFAHRCMGTSAVCCFPTARQSKGAARDVGPEPELSQATKSADSGPPCPSPSTTEKGPTSPPLFDEGTRPSLDLAKCPPVTRGVEPRDSPPPRPQEASLNSFSSTPPHTHTYCLTGNAPLTVGPTPHPSHRGQDPVKPAHPTPPRSRGAPAGSLGSREAPPHPLWPHLRPRASPHWGAPSLP